MKSLVNPSENIVTDSFYIQTNTLQGYPLDWIKANVTVNFYCVYPCASCNQDDKSHCNTCYAESPYEYWFGAKCLAECPAGFVNTTTYNCTACIEPCATCIIDQNTCTSCIEGYWKRETGTTCYLKVFYPFPWLCMGFIMFICIAISECVTKAESRFKEAFIALVCLPELGAWVTYIVFLFYTVGYKEVKQANPLTNMQTKVPAGLALIALGTYMVINFIHALIHPRKMIPNSAASYKSMAQKQSCTTHYHACVSYLLSFKYSLILVSYLWNSP
jgi:hypothetical protein